MEDRLRFEKVSRKYSGGPVALDQVDVSISAGEFVALVGPSGSGKSTFLHLACGLDRPDSGRVFLDGIEFSSLSDREQTRLRREKVGIVFQAFYTIPYLTAVENVMLAQDLHSMADEREALAALDRVGLSGRAHALPAEMSGGELQRLCITRALINRPSLLLADEPTGNLDEENESTVLDLFRELHREGQTIILVTHDLSVARLADRQLTLEHGHLLGALLTEAEYQEAVDEVLERIWLLSERGEKSYSRLEGGRRGASRSMLDRMEQASLLRIGPQFVELSETGLSRARNLIRRQRLAETLFLQTFQMDAQATGREACRFEHILSEEMTQSICVFLGHPRLCPHQAPIPRGDCCPT